MIKLEALQPWHSKILRTNFVFRFKEVILYHLTEIWLESQRKGYGARSLTLWILAALECQTFEFAIRNFHIKFVEINHSEEHKHVNKQTAW